MSVIAIIGRPNVGKSSLFNRIVGTRKSIEAAEAGTTRDRVYGHITHKDQDLTFVDVAGVLADDQGNLAASIQDQIKMAEQEADAFLFVVNVQEGMQTQDELVADRLRRFDLSYP